MYELMLYIPVNIFSQARKFSMVEPVLSSKDICPAQGHNTVPLVRLEVGTSGSQV